MSKLQRGRRGEPLFIPLAQTMEEQIGYLQVIEDLPYPASWFYKDEARTRAMYHKAYTQYRKDFHQAMTERLKEREAPAPMPEYP